MADADQVDGQAHAVVATLSALSCSSRAAAHRISGRFSLACGPYGRGCWSPQARSVSSGRAAAMIASTPPPGTSLVV
ncbi:hypothetical protein ACFYWY_25605 [Streptomyces sp. NPDC002870]|uniref:hypothetical protein n=1 Tax=Streptomyces sp. NPDC002870 TaxID=3364666 RepID=UPI0036AD808B